MQVGVDVESMHTNFGGRGFSDFGIKISYSPWSSKNLINRNQLKKFMLVGVDVKCMYTDFGGHDLSGFRDTVTFKNGQISFSDHGL